VFCESIFIQEDSYFRIYLRYRQCINEMKEKEYFALSDQGKDNICQKLSPYDDIEWSIFKTVQKLFIEKYGHQDGIEKVVCSLAPMMGPHNCIMVFIPKGKKPVKIPEIFLGFPIWKIYESKQKTYKQLLNDHNSLSNSKGT
jgi:hypothetical protein